tara:strand:- start:780 stop:2153 length:1374 start_codon:yes stop_codon:yes gene_type:complete
MNLENRMGSLLHKLGYAAAAVTTGAMMYFGTPVFAQEAERVKVVVNNGDGRLTVTPEPKPTPNGGKTPSLANTPKKVPSKSTQPAPQYGTNPLCGTDATALVGGDLLNFSDYACLTDDEAIARGLDPNNGLSGDAYTSTPAQQCPGAEKCYSVVTGHDDEPSEDPVDPLDALAKSVDDLNKKVDGLPKVDIDVTVETQIQAALKDGDADGVRDPSDNCPGTPYGTAVSVDGCEVPESASPWFVSPIVEVLNEHGTDVASLQYGVSVGYKLTDDVAVQVGVGGLYQHGSDLESRTTDHGSPDATRQEKLLPDGTTYKETVDTRTTDTTTTVRELPHGGFVRVRSSYDVTPQVSVFGGADVRVRETETTVEERTDLTRTTTLTRNDETLRNPKTISDSFDTPPQTTSEWSIGVVPHLGVEGCFVEIGQEGGLCGNVQGGYDLERERVNYGAGLRLRIPL